MADLLQRGAVSEQLIEDPDHVSAGLADPHQFHFGFVHGWIWVWEFPAGVWWPVCACAYLPDDGFASEDLARESVCLRLERQRSAV
jgi:hypothetical protein